MPRLCSELCSLDGYRPGSCLLPHLDTHPPVGNKGTAAQVGLAINLDVQRDLPEVVSDLSLLAANEAATGWPLLSPAVIE